MIGPTWIVVADGARGRVFSRNSAKDPVVSALPHDFVGSRQPVRERVTDRAGQTHERNGPGGHAKGKSQDAKAHDQEVLAQQLAAAIRSGRTEQRFSALVLVAPPAFLGLLRQAIDAPSAKLVVAEHAKDLSRLPEHELAKRLDVLAPPSN